MLVWAYPERGYWSPAPSLCFTSWQLLHGEFAVPHVFATFLALPQPGVTGPRNYELNECLEPSANSVLFSHYWSQMLLSQPQEANVPPRQVFAPKCLLSSWSLLALPSPSSVVNLGVPLFSSLQLCGASCLPSVSVDPAQDGYGHPGPFSGGNYN